MAKLKGTLLAMQSIFLKSVLQWRLVAALLMLWVLISLNAQYQLPMMQAAGGVHVLEPAIHTYLGSYAWIAVFAVFWLSDAPFFDRWEALSVPRTGRWPWMLTRLAYAILAGGLFVLAAGLIGTFAYASVIDLKMTAFSDFWGDGSGSFWYSIRTENVTPAWLFFTLFFMNWLGTCIFVLVTFAVNLRLKRGVGLGVGVGFWGVCEGWSFWVIMNMKWAFLAPTNNMTLCFNISKLTFQPAVQGESILMYAWVGVVYNILWLAALVAVILLLTPGYQFPFVKQRQNRFTD